MGDESLSHQSRRPGFKGALQRPERIRFVCACRCPLHIKEPFARLNDLTFPHHGKAQLPVFVNVAVLVPWRLEVYGDEFHGEFLIA